MSDPITEAVEAERQRALASFSRRPKVSRLAALEQIRDEMAEALACRLGGPLPESDAALRHVGAGFSSLVADLLRLRGVGWSGAQDLIWGGITTSDVPALLTGAGNRLIRAAYESYSGGLLRLCGRVFSRDARDVKTIQLDGDVALQPVTEGGEFTEGTVKASAETFPISTFGRVLGVSRTLLMDDDLAGFANLSSQLGRMAAEFVAGKVVTVLESNATLSDGVAVFHANHANLGTTGALSETTLGELLKLLRGQVGLAGERISAVPKALVVPPALEFTGTKLVALLGIPRPIEVVVEPRLTSATGFYVFADPATLPLISYTYPAGSEGPTIEFGQRPGFQGLQAKVTLDFGAGFTDFRGASKNVGA